MVCGACRSKIVPLFESRKIGAASWQGGLINARATELNPAGYLHRNLSLAKAALGGVPFAQLMQTLGKRWAVVRPETDDAAYWNKLGSKPEAVQPDEDEAARCPRNPLCLRRLSRVTSGKPDRRPRQAVCRCRGGVEVDEVRE